MVNNVREIEFHTLDHVKLRGLLFSAGDKRPCLIMSHGFAATKEQYLPTFAERFQKAGYSVLLYDHRNWGESDGEPRDETDPFQQVRDYYDAFDYAATLPEVDPSRIIYWGSSLSGGVAIMAAAFDKRICAIIVQAPYVSTSEHLGAAASTVVPMVFQDRATVKATGSSTKVPVYPNSLKEALNGTSKAILNQPDVFLYAEEAEKRGHPMNKWVTLQTVGHLLPFEPIAYIDKIGPKPLLMVVGENDTTTSVRTQLQAFHRAMEPKKLHVIKGVGHYEVYFGPAFEENVKAQLEFLSVTMGE